MRKLRRRKILMWVFGIVLAVGGSGFFGTLVLTHDFIHDPKDVFPPEMFILSIFGTIFAVGIFVLIGLFLTMKNRL